MNAGGLAATQIIKNDFANALFLAWRNREVLRRKVSPDRAPGFFQNLCYLPFAKAAGVQCPRCVASRGSRPPKPFCRD
jgi:hypothetical protein